MGRSGALWGALWMLLGRSWGDLGCSWAALRAVLGHAERSSALLNALRVLGHFWAFLGQSLGTVGAILGTLGAVWGIGLRVAG